MDAQVRSKLVNATCAPLFIGNYFLADGHNVATSNATATFVRLEGKTYIVTCRHVKEAASIKPGWTAKIHAGQAVVSLSYWSSAGLISNLHNAENGSAIDISICWMPDYLVELMARDKPKTPIDLDHYREPVWSDVTHCLAVGFPDRAKTDAGDRLISPMVEAIVEPASTMDPSHKTFTLQSQLDVPTEWGFSGMSGGPIFALTEDGTHWPIGIIYEGYPSDVNIELPEDSFLGKHDILIRGYCLTPDIFNTWIKSANL